MSVAAQNSLPGSLASLGSRGAGAWLFHGLSSSPEAKWFLLETQGWGGGLPGFLAAPPWGQRPEAPWYNALGAGYALAPHWDLPAQALTWLSPSLVSKS